MSDEVGAAVALVPASPGRGSARPWQVADGPEWELRKRLARTESALIALGIVLAALGVVAALAVLSLVVPGGWSRPSAETSRFVDGQTMIGGLAALAIAWVGALGLMRLRAWGRWAMFPLAISGLVASVAWTYRALERDVADPEAVAASTPEGRYVIVAIGLLSIVATTLPAIAVGRRRARIVGSKVHRFAVHRAPRAYAPWWVATWVVLDIAIVAVLVLGLMALLNRVPSGLVGR